MAKPKAHAFLGNNLDLHRPSTSRPENITRAAARIEDYVDPDLYPREHRAMLEMVFGRLNPTKRTNRGLTIAAKADA